MSSYKSAVKNFFDFLTAQEEVFKKIYSAWQVKLTFYLRFSHAIYSATPCATVLNGLS